MRAQVFIGAVVLGLVASGSLRAAGPAVGEGPLPALAADAASVSVSGLSSGGFMAVQMHAAHSRDIIGAGVFAGGPLGCARGAGSLATLTEAASHCVNIQGMPWNPLNSFRGPPSVPDLVRGAKALAATGAIDPLEGLQADRVYLFSGTKDPTVPQPVMDALKAWYATFMPAAQISTDFSVAAGHAMITPDGPVACGETRLPFINDCDESGAGKVLSALYGPLTPPMAAPAGEIIAFDQRPYIPDTFGPSGLFPRGHLFVPEGCGQGQGGCRLHVVFHGCKQNETFIGDQYYTTTGYNGWAASNRIVVLYPQAAVTAANPNGCWDWWGYTNQEYLTRSGVQIRAVWAMVQQLLSRP